MHTFKIILISFLLFPTLIKAQKYSGKWYGRAEAKAGVTYNSYLCELIILKKGNNITGELNYFFGQDEYKVKIKGTFFAQTKTIELQPFSLITFFSRDRNGPDCQMDGSLTLYVDGEDSVLYGQLNPLPKYKLGCPLMEINLHKESFKDTEEVVEEEIIHPVIPVLIADTAAFIIPQEPLVIKDTLLNSAVGTLTERSFSTGPLITVPGDTIILHLYDNGKVDNDTVSVFFNREPVALQKRLNLQPIILKLVLKPGINEIALFAENLGDIPPNTALCLIYCGSERFDINLSSSFLTNGTVRIKRRE